MSNIPTKGELNNNNANNLEAARQQRIPSDITDFTNQIVAAMGKGQTSLTVQLRMPEPEAQTQIIKDFAAKGWTVTFVPARTGGQIRWS